MAFSVIGYSMKFDSRRYNQSETSKEFYERRKQEMNEVLESDAWKNRTRDITYTPWMLGSSKKEQLNTAYKMLNNVGKASE